MYYGQEGLNGEDMLTADGIQQAAESGAAWAANAYEQYVTTPEQANAEANVLMNTENPKVGWIRGEAFDANRDGAVTRGEVRVFAWGTLFGVILGRTLLR
jgi:hypothetical protein